MTVAALLQFTQGANVGTNGVALLGTVAAGSVVAANANNASIARWVYTIVDAPEASALLGMSQDGTTPSFTFTPDADGTFQVQLTVYDITGLLTATDYRDFIAVSVVRGWIYPAFNDDSVRDNYLAGSPLAPNTRGWKRSLNAILHDIEAHAFSAGGGGFVDNAVIVASGTTVLVRPTGGKLYVPVNLVEAAGNVTLQAWNAGTVGDQIWFMDETFQAGHSAGGVGAYDLSFTGGTGSGNYLTAQWGTQTPTLVTTYAMRFAGDLVGLRLAQNAGYNSGNPYWAPLFGR
jgi:hypothetical protein